MYEYEDNPSLLNEQWWENHQWMLDNGLAPECQEDEPEYFYNPITEQWEEM